MYYYNRHKNKKIPCTSEEREKRDIEKKRCLHCKRVFSTPCALRTHLLNCKSTPSETEQLKQIILKLTETNTQQIKELQEINNRQIEKLTSKIDNIIALSNKEKKPTKIKKKALDTNGIINEDGYDYICETNLFIL